MQEERRREERKEIFIQCDLKPEGFDKNLPVWIKNFSSYGMKLIFFKMFYCSRCPKLEDLLHLKCSEGENCDLYNFENIIKFLSKGEITAKIENENIQKQYQIKWLKLFPELNTVEFGVEFLN